MSNKVNGLLTFPKLITFWVLCSCLVMCTFSKTVIPQVLGNEDYVVLNSGDTLKGRVEWLQSGGSQRLFKKVQWTDNNGKRRKFRQKEICAFRIKGADYERFYLQQSSAKIVLVNPRYDIDTENGECYFLRRLYKGHLSHYQMEWRDQGEDAVYSMDLFLKSQDTFFIRANQGIFGLKRKVLMRYFSDCPQLSSEIATKKINQAAQVVSYYYAFCL